jgi:hypothetical protein
MSEDALNRATRINELLAKWQKKVSGESTDNPLRIVELLGSNPFIMIKASMLVLTWSLRLHSVQLSGWSVQALSSG